VSTAVILRKFGNMTRLPQFLLEAPALRYVVPSNKAPVGKLEESVHPTAPLSRDMVNPRTVVNNIDRLCLPRGSSRTKMRRYSDSLLGVPRWRCEISNRRRLKGFGRAEAVRAKHSCIASNAQSRLRSACASGDAEPIRHETARVLGIEDASLPANRRRLGICRTTYSKIVAKALTQQPSPLEVKPGSERPRSITSSARAGMARRVRPDGLGKTFFWLLSCQALHGTRATCVELHAPMPRAVAMAARRVTLPDDGGE